MPDNFSFVIPGRLAGMARPGRGGDAFRDLAALPALGVGAVASLVEDAPDPIAMSAAGLVFIHIPVTDFTPPTQGQIDRFVKFVREQNAKGLAVAAHCGAGLGRTGTMIACQLVADGDDAETALRKVRAARPGSVETAEQAAAVRAYAKRRRCAGAE